MLARVPHATHVPDRGVSNPSCANLLEGDSGVVARGLLEPRGVSPSSGCCMLSSIFPIAFSGLLTASCTELPVRRKNRFVLSRAGKDAFKLSGRAGSSPGVDGAKGDISIEANGRDICVDGDGGRS